MSSLDLEDFVFTSLSPTLLSHLGELVHESDLNLGHSGHMFAVTGHHNASRWVQQPLPPTTTTEGLHRSKTTTADNYL